MIGLRTLLLTAALTNSAVAATHCATEETTVFSCVVGRKIASVCATASAVQYRFGPEGRAEIAWPPGTEGHDLVRSGSWTFAGGGGAWLAFHNPPYRYIVYTAIGRGWGQKAGVAVEQDGHLLTNLRCAGTPVSKIGPDFFTHAGIADDTMPFELP